MRKLRIDKKCLAVRNALRRSKKKYGPVSGADFMLVDTKCCAATDGIVLIEVERQKEGDGDPVLLPRDAVMAAKRSLKKSDEFTVELVDKGKLQVRADGPPQEFDAAEDETLAFPDYETKLFRPGAKDLFAVGVRELEVIVKAAKEAGIDSVRLRRSEDEMNGYVEFVSGPYEKDVAFRAVVRPRTEPGQTFTKKEGENGD